MNTSYLDNPWKRVFIGLLFLIGGVGLGWLSDNNQWIIDNVCGNEKGIWCFPLKLVFFDLGLKSVSYTLIVIGCILVVLYNFVAELLGSILSFALNHVSNSSKVVLDAMERNRITREESSEIIRQTIARYKGYRDRNSESFADFLQSKLITQNFADNGFWRQNFSSIVEVKNTEASDPVDASKYLKWMETSRFTVANEKKGQTYKYSSVSITDIDGPESLEGIIGSIRYDVRIDGKTEFSFADIKEQLDLEKLKAGEELNLTGLKVKLLDNSLKIDVELPVIVSDVETDVVIDEESYISVEDNTYELSFFEPTKGFTFRFNLPEGFDVYHRGVSGQRFGSQLCDDVTISRDVDNRVRVDSNTWSFPGIVAMLVWKKKAD